MAKAGGKKCNCNPGWLIVAVVLLTLGLYALVAGFSAQFQQGAGASTVLPWYFVGILLVVFGKLTKWKSHGTCPVHSMR